MNAPVLCISVVVLSLSLTAALVPPLRRWATSIGLLDDPSGGTHKTHQHATPYGGGAAIYAATLTLLTLAFFALLAVASRDGAPEGARFAAPLQSQLIQIAALFAGATAVFAVGLLDDWRGLPFLLRLVVQVAAATGLVLLIPGFRLPLVGPPVEATVVMTVLWITALTNAFNFLDNMNGLTAGLASICAAAAGIFALEAGHTPALALCLVLLGATVGFLLHNFPAASVFMGDAGGLFLGFICGGLAVLLSDLARGGAAGPASWPHALAPLLVLAVPAYDLITVVALRLGRGVAPWHGDTNHISHRLVRLGLSRRDSVLTVWGASLAACLWSLALPRLPETAGWVLILGMAGGAVGVALIEYVAHRRHLA